MGRIICELERIYGVKNGNNQYTEDGRNATTQKDLANKLSISQTTYKEDKNILKLLPELQEMVDTGSLTTSVAINKGIKIPLSRLTGDKFWVLKFNWRYTTRSIRKIVFFVNI